MPPTTNPIPHIHLLCMDEIFIHAFQSILSTTTTSPQFPKITFHNCSLSYLPPTIHFDAIISPANSYGRLDGGFDDAISRAFSPTTDYLALTRHAQGILYRDYRGYLPPGSCTLISIPGEFIPRSKNVWGTRYLALCPTMRVPQDVRWDREIVYECVWSLLCAVDRHNSDVERSPNGRQSRIDSLLMTPFATGCGFVSPEKWAKQMILALNHYIDAVQNPQKWSCLDLGQAMQYSKEVARTWES
ncbi:hypothetical protein ASPBRDRAFT_199713 [Aspergillus brasiliensis CBS 101740]|uniref:ADP-ribose 1''-phosphate phosphatase n=1 Tax=Aspergillus brasiliensis (strain CBS 101740 / IMI 381727 / IBT 21946) TaxID=767769 RepID=A0A1L9U8L3_ASPBC|nr:hypothetical protein ASPBRDRAFT_199713 [Aspergillus brasiliensis CBS 101740]